jgi:hypothetical protein
MLRPFFPYYGSKWSLAKRYPAPRYDRIIEPFAAPLERRGGLVQRPARLDDMAATGAMAMTDEITWWEWVLGLFAVLARLSAEAIGELVVRWVCDA